MRVRRPQQSCGSGFAMPGARQSPSKGGFPWPQVRCSRFQESSLRPKNGLFQTRRRLRSSQTWDPAQHSAEENASTPGTAATRSSLHTAPKPLRPLGFAYEHLPPNKCRRRPATGILHRLYIDILQLHTTSHCFTNTCRFPATS